MNFSSNNTSAIRDRIELENSEKLYETKNELGKIIGYKNTSGRQLFNHYHHRMTNYNDVLDGIHNEQGIVAINIISDCVLYNCH